MLAEVIYWDNNATTAVAPEVLEAMLPFLRERYFNPSAAYAGARQVRRAVEEAREAVAALVGAHPDEIVFTSGGTEATNSALAFWKKTAIAATEHPATLHSAHGVVLAPVTPDGRVDPWAWDSSLAGCDGCSFAWANHETGVLQEAESLIEAAARARCGVHVDCVQAAGKVKIDLSGLPVHFASLSAHKIHGPKGIGALYVRRGVEWSPWMRGGAQESHRRAGTENVPGIVGFGEAARQARIHAEDYRQTELLRDFFERGLKDAFPDEVIVHGGCVPRLPHVSNLRIAGFTAESLMLLLEPWGLVCAAGSACTTADPRPSHVLQAMGLADEEIRGALRFSLSRMTTRSEAEQALELVIRAVRKLRSVQSAHTGPVTIYRPKQEPDDKTSFFPGIT